MRVRFCGLGGQGIVISGVIYGHAAMLEGFEVLQSQSYGSTTRGGVTTADVTLDQSPIYELECPDVDLLVALCQEASDRFRPLLVEGGVLVTERSLIDVDPAEVSGVRHVEVAALEAAREQLGRQILANIVTLGAVAELVEVIPAETLSRAIAANVPPGTQELNERAFELGRLLCRQLG